jgi:hypothetical protein
VLFLRDGSLVDEVRGGGRADPEAAARILDRLHALETA